MEIWKGKFQLGPLSMGEEQSFCFKHSNATWHSSSQWNSASFIISLKRGEAILVNFQ